MPHELPIPDAATRDEASIEMIRVWIAKSQLHTSLKVGYYTEATKIPEPKAWGFILADAARHLANALEEGYGANKIETLETIRKVFISEIESSQVNLRGKFKNS